MTLTVARLVVAAAVFMVIAAPSGPLLRGCGETKPPREWPDSPVDQSVSPAGAWPYFQPGWGNLAPGDYTCNRTPSNPC